jgi:hypothetical protein
MDKDVAARVDQLLGEIRSRLATIEELVSHAAVAPEAGDCVTQEDLLKFGEKDSRSPYLAHRLWRSLTARPLAAYFEQKEVPLTFYVKGDGPLQPVANPNWDMGPVLMISVRSLKAAAPFAYAACVQNFGSAQQQLLQEWAKQM